MQLRNQLSLLFCLLFSFAAVAQTGIAEGVITDSGDGTSLPGASVYLKNNAAIGTVTDLEGNFRLLNVPVGEQTLIVSYIGFESQERTLTITKGEITTIKVKLGGQVITGEVVTVSAQALGQAKAINQQLSSDGVANFVSADKIKELPDVNAAEAISRLPGVAINRSGGEGSKIVVRGLDPKFTSININGVRLPSTSGNDRSVDLALISPELLSGIELFKSPTPDMDGDALGGTVNLNIIKADDRPRASLKATGGYNDIAQQFRDYRLTGSMSRRVLNDKLGVIATANVERFNRSARVVGGGWGDNGVFIDTFLNIQQQWATGLNFRHTDEIRRRYNGSLGLDYTLGQKTDITVLGIYSRTTRDRFTHRESYGAEGGMSAIPNITENSIDLYSASLTARHKLDFMNIEWGVNYSKTMGNTPVNLSYNFFSAGIPVGDPARQGENRRAPSQIYQFVDPNPNELYLNGANAQVSSNQEAISTAFIDFNLPVNLGDTWRGEFKFGGKFRTNEKIRTFDRWRGRLYYLHNLNIWNGLLPDGERAQRATGPGSNDRYLGGNNFLADADLLSIENSNGRDVNLFHNFDPDILRRFHRLFFDQQFTNGEDIYAEERLGITNNFDVTENLFAGYLMFKLKMGDQLTIIPGFRYEGNDNTYNGILAFLAGDFGENGLVEDRTAEQQYGQFLPHLHLKYKPLDWFDIRASYSTTIARPDFNYLVPSSFLNRSSTNPAVTQGNPNLGPSVSTNYDLFLTAFNSKFGLISVGGFYKDIQDIFYPFITGVNDTMTALQYDLDPGEVIGARLTTYESSPESQVYGVEFDLQTNLNFLPGALKNLIFNFNYARLWSNTTINNFRTEDECVRPSPRLPPICRTSTFPVQREANLIGQAEQILNASLGYDLGGFSARISAAYQGTKLTSYVGNGDKDRFDREFWRMDAALKYRFSRRLNVFLNLNNLTNQQDVTFFREVRLETSRQTFGTTATVGVEIKFLPKDG